MLSGHVMFTALVPYGSLSLPLFALRWIKLISLALDTGQSESIGGDMRSKSGIIQNSRFSKIVFLISRVHHQCYSSVSPLRAQNASTTSFVSRSHWSQSSQANNQYCPFLFYNVATISVKNNHLQDLNTNSFDIECMSVFTQWNVKDGALTLQWTESQPTTLQRACTYALREIWLRVIFDFMFCSCVTYLGTFLW